MTTRPKRGRGKKGVIGPATYFIKKEARMGLRIGVASERARSRGKGGGELSASLIP